MTSCCQSKTTDLKTKIMVIQTSHMHGTVRPRPEDGSPDWISNTCWDCYFKMVQVSVSVCQIVAHRAHHGAGCLQQVTVFIVTGDSDEHSADILVIDDELHDVEPATQSSGNQHDVSSANHMLVPPDQVSSFDYKIMDYKLQLFMQSCKSFQHISCIATSHWSPHFARTVTRTMLASFQAIWKPTRSLSAPSSSSDKQPCHC